MKPQGLILFAVATLLAAPVCSFAQGTALMPLQVPAKTLPVPYADISPQMQKIIAAPLNPNWNDQ